MSAPSPTLLSGSLTSFTIKVAGQTIPSTIQVESIETSVAVNRLPKARLVIFDGSAATATFPVSSLNLFLPGNKITIALGYNETKRIEAAEVIESIVTGKPMWPTFEDGHRIIQIVDACFESSNGRRWVDISHD